MNNRIIFVIVFLIMFAFEVKSQSKTETNLVFLSNSTIADVNLNKEKYLSYMQRLADKINQFSEKQNTNTNLIVQVVLSKDSLPDYQLSARPALSNTEINALLAELVDVRPLNTRFSDFAFLYEVSINGGCKIDSTSFYPIIQNPFLKKEEQFKSANLSIKKEMLQNWTKKEVLPILSAFAEQTNEKFQGVKIIGDRISEMNMDSIINVKSLTDDAPNYWRAVMEMEPSNFLIISIKVFLHVAAGEFEMAQKISEVLPFFKKDKTVADYYLDELWLKMDLFNNELNNWIEKGVLLHDQGKYLDAVKIYDSILNIVPLSAWANYEKYYSLSTYKTSTDSNYNFIPDWQEAKILIYKCNPLYTLDVNANNGKEAWHVSRRMSINDLFKNREKLHADFLEYADIAFDLGEYSLAAHFYWLIVTHFSKEESGKRNIAANYLYCLEKLGHHNLVMLFDINTAKEFKKIENDQKERMENSTFYKAFK